MSSGGCRCKGWSPRAGGAPAAMDGKGAPCPRPPLKTMTNGTGVGGAGGGGVPPFRRGLAAAARTAGEAR